MTSGEIIYFIYYILEGAKRMPISTSTIIVAIIATLCLIGSLIGKIRWLTLIAIFLYLIAAWMIVGEYFTGIKF